MALQEMDNAHLEKLSEESLLAIENIATTARKKCESSRNLTVSAIVSNTWNSTAANDNLERISSSLIQSYNTLTHEPTIARIVAYDNQNNKKTYYICRATPVSGLDIILASYNSPVGRLASLPIGEMLELPNGTKLEVTERTRLRPKKSDGDWDSIDSIIETESLGPLTIKSMRALVSKVERLLNATGAFDNTLLDRLLAEEQVESNILDGLRRSVIDKMGIRDQPILDKYQDEIFRLQLNKKLVLLGPPGTGKTTTLIRRLGQKSDFEYLDDTEKNLVKESSHANRRPHEQSWIMFTPTELLKIYLKEAFAREGVPAPDKRIRTWSDFRREIGRSTFSILRTANGGSFVLKDNENILLESTVKNLTSWCDDFEFWQKNIFASDLFAAAKRLRLESDTSISDIGIRLDKELNRFQQHKIADMCFAISALLEDVKAIESNLKSNTNAKIESAITLQLNRDHGLLDKLVVQLDVIQQQENTPEDTDDEDTEEEEDVIDSRSKRGNAAAAFKQALRAQARSYANNKKISLKSRNGQLLDWIGDRALSESECGEIGAQLVTLSLIRKFKDPLKRYIHGLQRRYKAFRRQRQKESLWYSQTEFNHSDINPLELDIVIYSVLNFASSMLERRDVIRNIDDSKWNALRPVHELFLNQVFVDEATDFSPVQLACMEKLSHPVTKSFFASGDFNQRLTLFGVNNLQGFKWAINDISTKNINIVYRQSRQLHELAISIVLAVNGDSSLDMPVLPDHVDSEGVPPVLIENTTSNLDVVSTWLADRVREVERIVQKIPSIAVFVDNESKVQPVADALNIALEDANILAVGCPSGQVMGNDNDVRIFDIQHIKGLEFEAVFFVGIDLLAFAHPELFDKYLYVGITRAATYLGITCETTLPEVISPLRHQFVESWAC